MPAGGAFVAGAGAAGGAPPLPSTSASTSSFVTLPPRPVPSTPVRSSPCASAIRTATGVAFASPLPVFGFAAEGSAGAAGLAGAAAAAPGWIRATIVPDWTVSSGSARISATTPATGDGISASTLSVEISTSVSPSETWSPTCLCHSSTVPSWTDSPICGSTTSTRSADFAASSLAATCAISVAAGSLRSAPPSSPRWSASACSVGAVEVGGAGLAPFVSISPSTVPTGTVSSASTRILTSVPATGAGTSASTLSVETSSSVSFGSTWSPTCLSHSSTVPSVTESPIWGMVICTVVPASI